MKHISKNTFSTKELTTISFFVVFTIILAQIAIPLPFTPMPISLGIVAVYICAILQKPKHAVFTQVCYLLIGAIGIPVFGEFRGGFGALFGPTGGYLMTYPIVAGIVSAALSVQKEKLIILRASIAIIIAHTVLYFGGTIWISFIMGISVKEALFISVYPFILPDVMKIVFCIIVIIPMKNRVGSCFA